MSPTLCTSVLLVSVCAAAALGAVSGCAGGDGATSDSAGVGGSISGGYGGLTGGTGGFPTGGTGGDLTGGTGGYLTGGTGGMPTGGTGGDLTGGTGEVVTGGTGGNLTGGTGGYLTGGTGGMPTGGTGGDLTGGFGGDLTGGTGGFLTGGTGGDQTGGTGGDQTGGSGGAQDDFWQDAYDPAGLPPPPNQSGRHDAGQACMPCHQSMRPFLFGGTVYQSGGFTGAANVQVGVLSGGVLYTAYSGTNGNFWVSGTGSIDWANAQVRIRTANGEIIKPATADNGPDCNSCHTGGQTLIAP